MSIINQQNNILIFLGCGFFVILSFIFILSYSVDVPFWDEWKYVSVIDSALDGENFWEKKAFLRHEVHVPWFYQLILFFDVLVFSWNVVYEMFFGWSLLIGGILFLYFLIREHNHKFKWLIIPMAAILFSPLQHENFLWGFASIVWFGTTFSLIASIYFLNKKKTSLTFSIIFGVIASFSSGIGLLIWPIGTLSLLKKPRSLIIWLLCMAVVYSTYYASMSLAGDLEIKLTRIHWDLFLSLDPIEYILLFLSNGLETNLYFLQLLLGGLILVVIILSFKKFREKNNHLLPWIQLGLIGIFAAIITELFRLGLDWATPESSRYVTMSNFSLIAFVIIISIVILEFRSNKKSVQFTIIPVFIIFGIILSSSYYQGWVEGEESYQMRTIDLECITDPNSKFKCKTIFWNKEVLYDNVIKLKEWNLGPFR